jgi:hypothetical protein
MVKDCAEVEQVKTFKLYLLGLNTLQALMFVLRLQREWDLVTKHQYVDESA